MELEMMGFALSVNWMCITSRLKCDNVRNKRRNLSYMLKVRMHLLHVHYHHTCSAHDLRPFLVHERGNSLSHSSLNSHQFHCKISTRTVMLSNEPF